MLDNKIVQFKKKIKNRFGKSQNEVIFSLGFAINSFYDSVIVYGEKN